MQVVLSQPDKRSPRVQQRQLTRQRLLNAAVTSLIEVGVARTTTLEVQRRSGASRGALLHHFPSHAAMLSATIEELVRRNDEAVHQARMEMGASADPLELAIKTLAAMSAQPAFMAELELWATSRTDPDLRAAIQEAERRARSERERVIAELFAPISDKPNCDLVVEMSIEFIRGLALTSLLVKNSTYQQRLVEGWIWAAEALLKAPPRKVSR